MYRIFRQDSPYKKQARFLAVLWTLFIFFCCFTPAKHIPKVQFPLVDKWVHLILFGGFTFLWLCSRPVITASSLISLLLIAIGLGALIEIMQGIFVSLGRSMELMDAVADSIGGALGIGLFCLIAHFASQERVR